MKLLKVAVAVLVMVGMALPVIAEDRLSLGGEMRVRGWNTNYDIDGVDTSGSDSWADQRLRIGGKIAVAEGVSITFRTDITESNWGSGNTFGSGRTGVQQWDRAHIDLTKGSIHLRAGQQYVAYGKTYAIDEQSNGIAADYVFGDSKLNAFFLLDDDNGGKDQADSFLTGARYSGKFDSTALNFFVGNYKQNGNDTVAEPNINDANVTLIGADVTLGLDAFTLAAELDYFTGDSSETDATNSKLDAYGTQFMLDASMAASDALTIGGQFFYGLGDDEDVQYTGLGNGFGGWDPVMDIGTDLSNEQISFGNPFNVASIAEYEQADLSITSAGSIGGRLYTNFKMSNDLKLGASAGYFVSEEDKIADIEVMALAGGLVYNLMENTSLQLQLQYVDGTLNETAATRAEGIVGDTDFSAFKAGTGLFVKF
jgi:hypothetical protein